jgi:hypothetical protein
MGPNRHEVPREKLGIVELSTHTAIRSNDAFPNERARRNLF